MIIVTGAAGFIGSNLVKALNDRGERDILAVDNLTRAEKFRNLIDCEVADYLDKQAFLNALPTLKGVRAILHQGACSDTMESDGRYMMENNYRYSMALLDYAQTQRVPLIYASSAAVYGQLKGHAKQFIERREFEQPLNVYGYSKFLFDQSVRRYLTACVAPIVGLRYFNVYGPRETHKARMASVAFHHFNQFRAEGKVRLFEGWDGWPAGGQSRDFIFIDDVVAVNLFFLGQALASPATAVSGIFNCGTGRAQPFNEVAMTVVNTLRDYQGDSALPLPQLVEQGLIEYIAFPEALKGKYQSFTQADSSQLRAAGYQAPMASVEQGVKRYVDWLAGR